MFTLTGAGRFEQDVKKSRFVAWAGPTNDEDEARRFIAAHGAPDAGHNCWAFRVGPLHRFNDDGEPGGTAGRPILQAIEGQDLDRVAVVVSRWFGGILLGTGGLVRAYGGTASACLRAMAREPIIAVTTLSVACAFADEARLRAALAALPATLVENTGFTPAGVLLRVTVPCGQVEEVIRKTADVTRGQAAIQRGDAA